MHIANQSIIFIRHCMYRISEYTKKWIDTQKTRKIDSKIDSKIEVRAFPFWGRLFLTIWWWFLWAWSVRCVLSNAYWSKIAVGHFLCIVHLLIRLCIKHNNYNYIYYISIASTWTCPGLVVASLKQCCYMPLTSPWRKHKIVGFSWSYYTSFPNVRLSFGSGGRGDAITQHRSVGRSLTGHLRAAVVRVASFLHVPRRMLLCRNRDR